MPAGPTLDFSRAQPIPPPGSGVTLDFSRSQPLSSSAQQSAPPQSSFTANPNREGTYKMNGPNGAAGIPFSNVYQAQQSGYKLDPSDASRFNKDWAAAPGQRNMIAPYSPSLFERARNVVANSAIGHSVEQALPKVADALNLHPTESINSPTYQSDANQLLAPQFLIPGTPQTHAGRIAQGALTGVGKLTSGNSLATMGALAATGGLAAPLAPVATGLKVAGTGMGLYGAGRDLYQAGKSYLNGNSAAGDEQLGEALPNAALMLPALGQPIESFGDFAQDKGADLMDSYLKAGKRAYRYDADPGRGILEQGPGTSVGFTREGFAQGVDAAKNRVGATIPNIIDSSTAQIPRAALRGGQDAILQSKTNVLNGPGGTPSLIPALQDLRGTMGSLVDTPGFASPAEVYAAKRNMDDNINWGRDVDAKDATANNMRREMRSDLSSQLYDAVPQLEEPSRQYGDLSSASKLATDRTYDRNGSIFNPFRIASMLGSGLAGEATTHNPGLSTGLAVATGVLPEIAKAPLVKTGGATALYQMGRALAATGRGLSSFTTPASGAGAEDRAQYSPYAQEPENQNDGFQQNTPPNGSYRSTNVTPEIIRPGDMSRSRFGVGPDGRAGVLVRPLGALPAPTLAAPEATPYSFANSLRPGVAIPGRSPMALQRSIGTAAHTIPNSVLGDILPPGTPDQQAAALRQANLGSFGDLAPSRSFAPPPANPEISTRPRSGKFPGLRKGRQQ